MTQAQQDALADGIAAGLRERKEMAAERSKRERENWLRNSERAHELYQRSVRVREMRGQVERDSEILGRSCRPGSD
jgi:hypothetical protein